MSIKELSLHSIKFDPLTPKQIHEKTNVKGAYGDFWNSVKFSRGWNNPPFLREEVEQELDTAAEAVARIRSYLDEIDPSIKFRMVDGSAREYLWGLTTKPKSRRRFVRAIVKATFRDARGYVEDLTPQEIDKFLDRMWEHQDNLKKEQKSDIRDTLKTSWINTEAAIQTLFKSDSFTSPNSKVTNEDLETIQNMIKSLGTIQSKAEQLSNNVPMEQDTQEKEQDVKDKEEDVQENESEGSSLDDVMESEESEASKQEAESMHKLKVLAEDVEVLRTRIQHLTESTNKLDFETLVEQAESEKYVEGLNKKCLYYTEALMNDLLKLDSVVGSEESRPVRKEQVKTIQAMMEGLDALKPKLQDMLNQLRAKRKEDEQREEERRKAEEEKRRAEEKKVMEEQKRLEQERKAEEKRKMEEKKQQMAEEMKRRGEQKMEEDESEEEKSLQVKNQDYRQKRDSRLRDKWRQLKLNPKFQVQETRDAYIIQGFIPGMKQEEIKVNLSRDRQSLTLEGVRQPTPDELQKLKAQLVSQLQADHFMSQKMQQLTPEDEDMLLLRAGLGRYGRFSETYQLPSSVDVDNIDGSYEKGVLRVVIPKVQHRRPNYVSPFGQFRSGQFQDPFVYDQDSWW